MSAFPAQDVHYELSEAEKFCPDCHQLPTTIGSYPVRQELFFIPARIKCLNVYKCEACSQNQPTDKIIKAPVAKAPLNHSYGSASILVYSLYQKYEMKVPDYRQESYWNSLSSQLKGAN